MSDTQRWTIDTIEEGTASVELPDGKVITVPAAILPKAARAGQILRVTIELDPAATRQARADSAAQVKKGRDASRKRDKGGDIVL